MATLVLTTVGTLVGGPVGGAIGALIGQRIDGSLFGTARQGPRLGDLSVQTSSYGSAIPRLFGRMRVAGTVIWATDLKETSHRSGGKGQASTTRYSYSASFAVALSARRVRSIGRIWADGMLLRGAAGDWKTPTGFRFHDGGEDQAIDPLIAAVEGASAPAYRGTAYVVFEAMQLAAYGNRIPSLRFEMVADDGPVTPGAIAADVSGGDVADATTTLLTGYAATGDSVRGAIEMLAETMSASLVEADGRLTLRDGSGAAILFAETELGAATGGSGGVRQERTRRAAGTVPDEVSISYYDVDRDYQAGLQRARRDGPGRRVAVLELPAVLPAGTAKAMAERRLAAEWAARRSATIRLPWRRLAVLPGQAVRLADSVEGWTVASATLDRMVVELRLVGSDAIDTVPLVAASAGRVLAERDRPHGATTLIAFEPPGDGVTAEGNVRIAIAAAGTSPAWRQAALDASRDGGASWQPVGRTAPAATIGRVVPAMPAAGTALFDDATVAEIRLLNDAMLLTGCSDAALLAGANLALIGQELIQFGRAEQIGIARFRIGRLLRGRWGTEAVVGLHRADEDFVLIDPERLAAMTSPAAAIGSTLTVQAAGIGDAVPVSTTLAVSGRALRPPAPVHLRATRESDGAILLRWTRRSRTGWDWIDGVDAPLGEEAEQYRLTVGGRTLELTVPEWRYPAALQRADGRDPAAPLTFAVAQAGVLAMSPATTATVLP
jgi:hypothetical protein